MLRTSLLLCIGLTITYLGTSQTLFRFGNHSVSKEEFKRAYSKNNTGINSDAAMREYLDLYVKFKLKVQAAKDQRLDTLASIKNDVAGFRAQMAEQYMQKLPFRKAMIEQAVERSKNRIEISHVFIEYGSDSLLAKKAIEKAYNQLQQGADFAITSRNFSTDPYVKAKDGYVGYISAFSLPYDLENVVYGLKAGSFSNPVAGKNGWHIFKVTDIKNNATLLKAAQIFITYAENATQEERSKAQQKADSIYQLLLKGADFGKLALENSNDKFTYQNEGVLPLFSYTDYDPSFSNIAFSLTREGDFSKPFQTSSGWHILKLIAKEASKTDLNNSDILEQWTQKVSQSERMKEVTANEKDAIRKAGGYKSFSYDESALWKLTDSTLEAKDYVSIYKANKQKKLFQLTEQTITVTDWLKYVKDKKMAAGSNALDGYGELMQAFTESTVTQYYKDHLEKINPDFKFQMQEFFEGSLLFEVMERNVWSVASSDTNGLKTFYSTHAGQYTWKKSVSAIIFNCADSATANKIHGDMQKDPLQWKQYAEASNGYALVDSSRFEISQLPTEEKLISKAWLSSVVNNPNDGSSSFCYVAQVHPENELRNFDEAKGLVINDYQLFLEEKWLNEQKKKYPVKVDDAVFKTLSK
jgi:peptidyl-prolyl cis-trans isomerase SurA